MKIPWGTFSGYSSEAARAIKSIAESADQELPLLEKEIIEDSADNSLEDNLLMKEIIATLPYRRDNKIRQALIKRYDDVNDYATRVDMCLDYGFKLDRINDLFDLPPKKHAVETQVIACLLLGYSQKETGHTLGFSDTRVQQIKFKLKRYVQEHLKN